MLKANGVKVDYWKTGHSLIKRRVNELGAIAGFEKSGHFYSTQPFGRGYDDGMIFALAVCDMLEPQSRQEHGRLAQGAAKDLGLADDVTALRR